MRQFNPCSVLSSPLAMCCLAPSNVVDSGGVARDSAPQSRQIPRIFPC